ncbi:hypothetical protein ACWEKM_13235 [Streptomyces sp. NPDC004752]
MTSVTCQPLMTTEVDRVLVTFIWNTSVSLPMVLDASRSLYRSGACSNFPS